MSQLKGYVAAAALVAIQVSIAIAFKASQTAGHTYTFSQASSLAFTEAIKFVLSFALLYREASHAGKLGSTRVSSSNDAGQYIALDTDGNDGQTTPFLDDEEQPRPDSNVQSDVPLQLAAASVLTKLKRAGQLWRQDLEPRFVASFALLALLYAINNHTAFFVFRLADPGTITLVKASSTIITASVMLLFLARSIRELQWHALVVQALSLAVTQLGNINIHYSLSTYALLLGMTTLGATAGVINESLLKGSDVSLHSQNMTLYAVGTVLNILIFAVRKTLDPQGVPAFFTGYTLPALALVLLQAILGLVITAVYKYADAILKGVATTIGTAILILLSALFFDAPLTLVSGVACLSVFLSSYTYIKAGLKPATPKEVGAPVNKPRILLGSIVLASLFAAIAMTVLVQGLPSTGALNVSTTRPGTIGLASELREEWKDPRCVRKPLPTSAKMFRGQRTTHRYDDTLMIVFFNKPLYNVNLDAFAEAYSPFFPNMLYIGPENVNSWEDGAEKTRVVPEVFVDQFQREMEKINGWDPQWPGAFAHHMFWTGVKDNPCYASYLWVAFDVWLNLPYLDTFPLDRVWIAGGDNTQFMSSPGMNNDRANKPPPGLFKGYKESFLETLPVPQPQMGWFGDEKFGAHQCANGTRHLPNLMRDRLRDTEGDVNLRHHFSDFYHLPGKLRDRFVEHLPWFFPCYLELGTGVLLTAISEPDEPPIGFDFLWGDEHDLKHVVEHEWANGHELGAVHGISWKEVVNEQPVGKPNRTLAAHVHELWDDGFARFAAGETQNNAT